MNKTILITDDDLDIREYLVEMLTLEGFTVIEAENGLEALQVIEKEHIDLVITDIFMKGMNGLELEFKLRREYPQIKIIGMTGGSKTPRVSNEVYKMSIKRFKSFLKKPFTREEMLEEINILLSDS
ncbi:MAG: response regulator [Planctomycetota bacterium]|nr:MAG: response regulator [Planctomycetota bacterium]